MPPSHEYLKELPLFESFFSKMGFKRIDGAVYGLLVVSENPLSSEEIESALNLSQSSISNSLKSLAHLGAIESKHDDKEKRLKLHFAKIESLQIVASVFRKREQEHVQEFRFMAQRLHDLTKNSQSENSIRLLRLKSIIRTCEMAETVMNFVIKISHSNPTTQHPQLIKGLSHTLDLLSENMFPLGQAAGQMKNTLTNKIKSGLNRFTGDL